MKKILLLLITAALFLSQGCEGYLDKTQESDGLTQEDVFTNYLNFRQFVNLLYDDLSDHLESNNQGVLGAVTDEGYTESLWTTMAALRSGAWRGLVSGADFGGTQFEFIWRDSWPAIRRANIAIQKIPVLEESGDANPEQIDRLKGQAHFMRAWWYFEILRRWGGMPYITKPLGATDNFALPRLSYYETAKMIAADCDTAAALLPERWDPANTGRATKGAAMALKSTALLFAASPTNNPSNESSRWEEAANAAWAFIDFAETTGRYHLLHANDDLTQILDYMIPGAGTQTITFAAGRDSVFMYTITNDEIIWEHYTSAGAGGAKFRTFAVKNLVDVRSRVQGFSPSQDIVDLFETENGLAIGDDPAYDAENPYVDRDPRFYQTILFNGEQHAGTYLELFNGGAHRPGEQFFNYTGYLSRKYWPSYVNATSGISAPPIHTIYLRYAGLLLQYAEAANEVGGPNYAVPGASVTAVEAVNMVRARVDMPPVDPMYLGSKEEFRKRIWNERAVELYMEQKRFFDLKRWHVFHLEEYRTTYGATITPDASKPTGYAIDRSAIPVGVTTFDQKHYRFPIPEDDAQMFEVFKQNPGW